MRFVSTVPCPMRKLVAVLVLTLIGVTASPADDSRAGDFRPIDIDSYVASARPHKTGTREMLRPIPVSFQAAVKQYPHPRKTTYLYTVLEQFPLKPRPDVSHRMFVTTPGGQIIPAYVEDGLVANIRERLEEDGALARFDAYHVYTYSKGPALLIVDFEPAP